MGGEKNESYVGEPLAKLWLFASVSANDITKTKEIKYKNISVGEPLEKLRLLFSVASPSLVFLRRPRAAKNISERAWWGYPLQNSGCSLQLVELIPRQLKKLNIKNISVGEPLEKFQLLSSVAPPSLDFPRIPRSANFIRLV